MTRRQVDADATGRRWLGVSVGLGALAICVAGWSVWSLREMQREAPARAAALRAELAALGQEALAAERARLQSALAERDVAHVSELAGLGEQHAAVVGSLQSELDDAIAAAGAARGERSRAVEDLARLEARAQTLQRDLDASIAVLEQSQGELSAFRRQYHELVGRNARLLEQVLEKDRRIEALGASFEELASRTTKPIAVVASPVGTEPSIAAKLNEALRASGARSLTIAQVGSVGEDGLRDLLVRHEAGDDAGPVAVLGVDRARLQSRNGRVVFVLEGARTAADGDSTEIAVSLPEFAVASWQALGLSVPGAGAPLSRIRQALAELVAPAGWSVVSLGAFDGSTLSNVELRQVDATGHILRELRAARATVDAAVGILELRDGMVAVGGEERAFYEGLYTLALPGAGAASWWQAVAGELP